MAPAPPLPQKEMPKVGLLLVHHITELHVGGHAGDDGHGGAGGFCARPTFLTLAETISNHEFDGSHLAFSFY